MVTVPGIVHAISRCLVVLLATTMLAACERGEDPTEPPAEHLSPEALMPGFSIPMTFAYACRDDTEFVMRIDPDEDHLMLIFDDRHVELHPAGSPPGSHYEADDLIFWLHGEIAVLHRHGEKPVHCLENRRLSLIKDARYRNVSVWGISSRPDWRLEVGPDHILLETGHGTDLHVFPMDAAPSITARQRQYESGNIDNSILVTVDKQDCYDSISDVTYDAVIRIRLNGEELDGCGVILH